MSNLVSFTEQDLIAIWSYCVDNVDVFLRSFLRGTRPISFDNFCLKVEASPFVFNRFTEPERLAALNELIVQCTDIQEARVQFVLRQGTSVPSNNSDTTSEAKTSEAKESTIGDECNVHTAKEDSESVIDNDISADLASLAEQESVLSQFSFSTLGKQNTQAKNDNAGIGESKPNRNNRLLSSLTFNTFIKGDNNIFAASAAEAVAKDPGKKNYNPLVFYSGVGLGKTHLMNAIGNYIIEKNPKMRVLYISAEQFMNEFLAALQNKKREEFHEKFRNSIDVLLIDDLQSLINKETTQEEFFHTFNELYNNKKQIVVSCDRPPNQIPTLTDRIKSRLGGGLVVNIQPPELETRIAILQKKANLAELDVPQEIITLIAERYRTNIRELEGAFISVINYCSLREKELNVKNAQEALQTTKGGSQTPDVDAIIKAVCEYFKVSENSLIGQKRDQSIVRPRQIAMYLIKEYANLSYPAIGAKFNRNHSTVLHSVRNIESNLNDSVIKNSLINLKGMLYIE